MSKKELLSQLPAINKMIDVIKHHKDTQELSEGMIGAIRYVIDKTRNNILNGTLTELPSETDLLNQVVNYYNEQKRHSLKPVVNGTGTIIHTNLGRSILGESVKQQLLDTSFSYTNLEYDLETGSRGVRYQHLDDLLKRLTGAEDVLVVNNNAAAVMLVLSTLIPNKEVVISRGELVEIGGSFRIPEVIKLSGGDIREVGTTNKTHLSDYEEAITEDTGALMKVHTSNYRIVGFSETPSMTDLAQLAHDNDLPLINDLGSGLFVDLQRFGLPYEPTIRESLAEGADVVMFSGDKLLGGTQAGIIVGKKEYIEPMKKNQLLRALRVDKLTLSMLEATLKLYESPEEIFETIPTLRMISLSKDELYQQATVLKESLEALSLPIACGIIPEKSNIGGGAYPEQYLDTFVVSITPKEESTAQLEKKLRHHTIPVLGRVKNNQLLLDPRTFLENDIAIICEAFQTCF